VRPHRCVCVCAPGWRAVSAVLKGAVWFPIQFGVVSYTSRIPTYPGRILEYPKDTRILNVSWTYPFLRISCILNVDLRYKCNLMYPDVSWCILNGVFSRLGELSGARELLLRYIRIHQDTSRYMYPSSAHGIHWDTLGSTGNRLDTPGYMYPTVGYVKRSRISVSPGRRCAMPWCVGVYMLGKYEIHSGNMWIHLGYMYPGMAVGYMRIHAGYMRGKCWIRKGCTYPCVSQWCVGIRSRYVWDTFGILIDTCAQNVMYPVLYPVLYLVLYPGVSWAYPEQYFM
jgi:hypothetical protein